MALTASLNTSLPFRSGSSPNIDFHRRTSADLSHFQLGKLFSLANTALTIKTLCLFSLKYFQMMKNARLAALALSSHILAVEYPNVVSTGTTGILFTNFPSNAAFQVRTILCKPPVCPPFEHLDHLIFTQRSKVLNLFKIIKLYFMHLYRRGRFCFRRCIRHFL